MDQLYVRQSLSVKVILNSYELSSDYEVKIKNKIKNKYGNTCYMNGFIKRSSIEIIKISTGRRMGSHLRGLLTFKVEFTALFCVPSKGKIIRCRITSINKIGALAVNYPMNILIPKQLQLHADISLFENLKKGDYIDIETMDYTISSNELIVVGIIKKLTLTEKNIIKLPKDAILSGGGELYQAQILTTNSPPGINNILGDNSSLNIIKDKISPFSKIWKSTIRYLIDPYALINIYCHKDKIPNKYNKSIIKYDGINGLNPIFSRAYFKLWELIMETQLLKDFKEVPIIIANLAEGPGGFIQCLIDYRNKQNNSQWKKDHYYAITLKSTNESQQLDWEWGKSSNYFTKKKKDGYNIELSYGNNTGNLLDIDNITAFSEKVLEKNKCHLVTADGGIELKSDLEYSMQELANAKLFFSEILTALTIQAEDGIFILKIYDIYCDLTIQMIILLSIYYDEIHLIKPKTSRPANSEKYIICQSFNGIKEEKLQELKILFIEWMKIESKPSYLNNTKFVHGLFTFLKKSDSEFMENIIEFNNSTIGTQLIKITEGIELIPQINGIDGNQTILWHKKYQKELAEKWCQDYDLPYITDLELTKLN